jgi:hypothetical protein
MKEITPIKAIRTKCIDCQGGSPLSVRRCEATDCPLFKFRLGKNPNRQGIGGNPDWKNKKPELEKANLT